MIYKIELTDNELRALKECLFNSHKLCDNTCCYIENADRHISCENCDFTKGVRSVVNKFSKLKPQS